MANPILKMFANLNAAVYKATGGKWMGKMGKSDICVVRMQGARSGQWRDIPLMYVPNGDGVILVASLGGAPKNPVWYANLVAHPDISVTHRGRRMELRARLARPEEKPKLWPIADKHYAPYADYRARTTRDIPIFVCEPRG